MKAVFLALMVMMGSGAAMAAATVMSGQDKVNTMARCSAFMAAIAQTTPNPNDANIAEQIAPQFASAANYYMQEFAPSADTARAYIAKYISDARPGFDRIIAEKNDDQFDAQMAECQDIQVLAGEAIQKIKSTKGE